MNPFLEGDDQAEKWLVEDLSPEIYFLCPIRICFRTKW